MKYSPESLKQKAIFLLNLKSQNDGRYMEFCFRLMMKTGRPMSDVERMIYNYAKGII